MLPGTTRSVSNIGKVHLTDETYCSCVCLLVFLVDLCGRAVHDFDGTLLADTNDSHRPSLHCESDSLVVKNAGQLDRKQPVILGCSVRLFPAILQATWLGSDLCRYRAGVGHPTTT